MHDRLPEREIIVLFNTLDRIRELRELKGWSVYRLAKESQIPQSTIATWYQKNLCPPIDKIEMICDAMGIGLSDFFADETRPLSRENRELQDYWFSLDWDQRNAVLSVMKSMKNKKDRHVSEPEEPGVTD